jgi:hypothetical protein
LHDALARLNGRARFAAQEAFALESAVFEQGLGVFTDTDAEELTTQTRGDDAPRLDLPASSSDATWSPESVSNVQCAIRPGIRIVKNAAPWQQMSKAVRDAVCPTTRCTRPSPQTEAVDLPTAYAVISKTDGPEVVPLYDAGAHVMGVLHQRGRSSSLGMIQSEMHPPACVGLANERTERADGTSWTMLQDAIYDLTRRRLIDCRSSNATSPSEQAFSWSLDALATLAETNRPPVSDRFDAVSGLRIVVSSIAECLQKQAYCTFDDADARRIAWCHALDQRAVHLTTWLDRCRVRFFAASLLSQYWETPSLTRRRAIMHALVERLESVLCALPSTCLCLK